MGNTIGANFHVESESQPLMDNQPLSVLVTDDHTLFRKGTMKLIESFPEVGQIHEAENGQEALRMLAEHDIEMILLDVDMPIMDGWQAAKKIVQRYPDVYIIMVSMNSDLRMVSDLIEIGVHSYILKNAHPDEMRKAIQSVRENNFYYNQLVSKALQFKEATLPEKDHLTPREIEIMQLICKELTMKEISEKIFVSEQTVMTHRKNLMRKIQVTNTVGIVRYAIQENIVNF